jgi:PEGA domain
MGVAMRWEFAWILCGAVLAGCSGGIPGLGGEATKVALESNPPGANASLSSGGNCKTPCTLPAPDKAGNYNVTFGLAGYAPVTIPIKVSMNKEHWYSSETATIEPNPVNAVLQPPAPARRQR